MRRITHIGFPWGDSIAPDVARFSITIEKGEEYLAFTGNRLWLSIDPTQPRRMMHFWIVEGDGETPEGYRYLGTCGERHLFVRNELQATQE